VFSGAAHVPEDARFPIDAFPKTANPPSVELDNIRELLETPRTSKRGDFISAKECATPLKFCVSLACQGSSRSH
jgi:hypothetical protein